VSVEVNFNRHKSWEPGLVRDSDLRLHQEKSQLAQLARFASSYASDRHGCIQFKMQSVIIVRALNCIFPPNCEARERVSRAGLDCRVQHA
jgi:hypothetical protein